MRKSRLLWSFYFVAGIIWNLMIANKSRADFLENFESPTVSFDSINIFKKQDEKTNLVPKPENDIRVNTIAKPLTTDFSNVSGFGNVADHSEEIDKVGDLFPHEICGSYPQSPQNKKPATTIWFNAKDWLHDQWRKASLSLPLEYSLFYSENPLESSPSIGFFAGLSMKMKMKVEPAFVQSYQLRQDQYSINFNVGGQYKKLGAQYQAYSNLFFSRPFSEYETSKKNPGVFRRCGLTLLQEKGPSLLSWPLFVWDIPWKAEHLKNKNYPVGTAMRLELGNQAQIGVGNVSKTTLKGLASLSVFKKMRWVLDVYKVNEERARIRLMAIRNEADLSADLRLSWSSNWGVDQVVDWITERVIGGKCNVLRLQGRKNLLESFPVSSWMADYELDISSGSIGEKAYDLFFENFKTLELTAMLNGFTREKTIEAEFYKIINPLEKAYQSELGIYYANYYKGSQIKRALTTYRWFKGKIQSLFSLQDLGSECGNVWEFGFGQQSSKHKIKQWDFYDRPQYSIYSTQSMKGKRDFLYKFISESNVNSFSTNYEAHSLDGSFEKMKPIKLTDIYWSHEVRDKEMKTGEATSYFKNLEYLYPEIISNPTYEEMRRNFILVPHGRAVNTSLRVTVALQEQGIREIQSSISNSSSQDLFRILDQYIEHYPGRLNLPRDGSYESFAATSYEDEALVLSRELSSLLENSFNLSFPLEARMDKFDELKRKNLFKPIGMGFLISQLSTQNKSSMFNFELTANSSSIGKINPVQQKPFELMPAYKSIEYLLNVWYNQDFDLKLQLNALQVQ